ncbi:MAG TPA: hypothetical protein VIL98_06205 [Gaiellaceae bacterium]
MGNFSRNTFNQSKNYVAVRLEQGVPLVDADWNELEDVTRFEIYEALRAAATNVASRGGLDLTPNGANDLNLSAGRAVIDGRPVRLWNPMSYSGQRYANAVTAAADGVLQATPLTQPGGNRTDCVYLDHFEREVTSAEDANLINGAIGLETSTRLKRELVLRVLQGSTTPPVPAVGHAHLAIALINRTAGPITAAQIQDVKPYPLPLGVREMAFAPALLPMSIGGVPQAAFTIEAGLFPWKITGRKPAAQLAAFGVIPIPPLPDGARLTQFRLRGANIGTVSWQFVRGRHDGGGVSTSVLTELFGAAGAFDHLLPIGVAEPAVNNSTFYYHLAVTMFGASTGDVYGGSIRFAP